MRPDWRTIDDDPPRENSDGPKRLMLWLPPVLPNQPGRVAFGRWNDDRHAIKPRPFWDYEHCRISESRARQPTHWAREPEGPTP